MKNDKNNLRINVSYIYRYITQSIKYSGTCLALNLTVTVMCT